MSKYSCKPCEYSTSRSTNYERHIQSKKHIDRRKKMSVKCKYCFGSFSSNQSKWNHENYSCKDKPIQKVENVQSDSTKIIELLLHQLNEKDNELKKQKDEMFGIIKCTTRAVCESADTFGYVIKHQAQPIKKLKAKDAQKLMNKINQKIVE